MSKYKGEGFFEAVFSVNEYDKDGDKTEAGIFLHFQNTRIKVAENIDGFRNFINYLENMGDEISQSYKNDLSS